MASFTGLVRADDGVDALELEHYPGMTEAALAAVAEEARARWSLLAATIVHRVGAMRPGERIVFVAAAAPHRAAALDACAFDRPAQDRRAFLETRDAPRCRDLG